MERLGKIYDIICKLDFFNQRAARELWNSKPIEIQNQDIFNRHQDLCELKEFVDDVAELIKLEEQGLLLKLPIAIGSTLWTNRRKQGWYFRLKDAPYRVEVVYIGLNDSEEMGNGYFNVCYENHDHMMAFNFSDLGKTVFLTKEEAEEALRKKVDE